MYPLSYREIGDDFNLEKVLGFGTLPKIYLEENLELCKDLLRSYTETYLQQEIRAEALIRNISDFIRFLKIAAENNGEIINYTNIGRETGNDRNTVKEFFQVLEDTLIGFYLFPFSKSARKRLVSHPKFYFFDCGVTNAVNKRLTGTLDPELRGRLFEQWIILETYRMVHYLQSEANLYFWRTNHGAEVDLVIEKHDKVIGAFEIKSTPHIAGTHLSGLRSFREEHPKVPCAMICTAPHAFEIDKIRILPWRDYSEKLRKLL
jgi:predicted AAA+ superfamily ATPase